MNETTSRNIEDKFLVARSAQYTSIELLLGEQYLVYNLQL